MTRIPSLLLIAGGLSGLFSSPAHGQWITFTDQTAQRIPADLLGDDSEKDVAFGNFNLDFYMDIFVARRTWTDDPVDMAPGPRTDLLLLNNGTALQKAPAAIWPANELTDARDVVVTDWNGDGMPDVAIATTFDNGQRLYENRGGGCGSNWQGFTNVSGIIPAMNTDTQRFCGIASGDVNGDLYQELFFANYWGGGLPPGTAVNDILLFNYLAPPRTYVDVTGIEPPAPLSGPKLAIEYAAEPLGMFGAFGTAAQIVDLDVDGDKDILLSRYDPNYPGIPGTGIQILWNDGTGRFGPGDDGRTIVDPGQYLGAYIAVAGDLNGDQVPDLYEVTHVNDIVWIAPSDGDIKGKGYTSHVLGGEAFRTTLTGSNVKMFDIDRDGDLDVGVANAAAVRGFCSTSGTFALLRNDGNGNLSEPWTTNQAFHLPVHDFSIIDLNGDACPDLFLALCTGYRVFIQNCS